MSYDPLSLTDQGEYLEAALTRAVTRNRAGESGLYSLLTTGEPGPDPNIDTNPKTPDGRDLAVDPTQGMGGGPPKSPDPMYEAFRAVGLA